MATTAAKQSTRRVAEDAEFLNRLLVEGRLDHGGGVENDWLGGRVELAGSLAAAAVGAAANPAVRDGRRRRRASKRLERLAMPPAHRMLPR